MFLFVECLCVILLTRILGQKCVKESGRLRKTMRKKNDIRRKKTKNKKTKTQKQKVKRENYQLNRD